MGLNCMVRSYLQELHYLHVLYYILRSWIAIIKMRHHPQIGEEELAAKARTRNKVHVSSLVGMVQ